MNTTNDAYWGRVSNAIADWLRTYMVNAGKEGYVVGISGGVDSAVAAKLAIMGVGFTRVQALHIPTKLAMDTLAASRVIEWLECPYLLIPMGTIARAIQDVIPTKMDRVAKGNIEARLRMIVLYAYANAKNYLVLGTSNKSELAIGYVTKYGDGGVDVEPLAEYYKTDVWKLAKYLGVPQSTINRKPTADLWAGQTDEEELGLTYQELDHILKNGDRANVLPEVYQRVLAMGREAQHKLRMPEVGPWIAEIS